MFLGLAQRPVVTADMVRQAEEAGHRLRRDGESYKEASARLTEPASLVFGMPRSQDVKAIPVRCEYCRATVDLDDAVEQVSPDEEGLEAIAGESCWACRACVTS